MKTSRFLGVTLDKKATLHNSLRHLEHLPIDISKL